MLRKFLVALVLAVAPFVTQATDYHVATTGNDDTGDGSVGTPWATMQHCADNSTCGDTCLVHVGTYTDCPAVTHGGSSGTAMAFVVDTDCTSSTPRIFKGAGDGEVILDGNSEACGQAFLFKDSDHHHIGGTATDEGFTINGEFSLDLIELTGGTVGQVNFADDATGVKFLGSSVTGPATSPISNDACRDLAINGTMVDIEVAYNTFTTGDCSSLNFQFSDNCNITACDTHGSPSIHHNSFIDEAGGAQPEGIFRVRNAGDVAIYNNYLEHNTAGNTGNGASPLILLRESKRIKFYNNMIYAKADSSSSGAVFVQDQEGTMDEGHSFANNTFYLSGPNGINAEGCTNCILVNNLFKEISGLSLNNAIRCNRTTNSTFGYNFADGAFALYSSGSAWGSTPSVGCATGSTGIVELGGDLAGTVTINGTSTIPTPFLRLASGSSAIDAGGQGLGVPTTDYDDAARDSYTDVGADEFNATPSCNDGLAEGTELCDGNNTSSDASDDDLRGVTCATADPEHTGAAIYGSGTLQCNTTCDGYFLTAGEGDSSASCTAASFCTDGTCDPDETECSCPADCGSTATYETATIINVGSVSAGSGWSSATNVADSDNLYATHPGTNTNALLINPSGTLSFTGGVGNAIALTGVIVEVEGAAFATAASLDLQVAICNSACTTASSPATGSSWVTIDQNYGTDTSVTATISTVHADTLTALQSGGFGILIKPQDTTTGQHRIDTVTVRATFTDTALPDTDAEATETLCSDGFDNDCDDAADCNDDSCDSTEWCGLPSSGDTSRNLVLKPYDTAKGFATLEIRVYPDDLTTPTNGNTICQDNFNLRCLSSVPADSQVGGTDSARALSCLTRLDLATEEAYTISCGLR